MGRLLLQEGEDFVLKFHPHLFSYADRYGLGLLWIGWGALAYAAQVAWPQLPTVGLLVVTLAAAAHAGLLRLMHRRGQWLSLGWAAVALLLALAWFATHDDRLLMRGWSAQGLALAAAVAVLWAAEWDRRSRRHILTSRRLLLRRGVRQRQETALDLERVQAVRGVQDLPGQFFRYGQLILVTSARLKPKSGDVAEKAEVLRGVPRFEETKHLMETIVDELHLPDRDRKRHAEERRLKGSMRALSSWVLKEGT